ncbi:MAG: hypothetical protein K2L07_07970 [Lachnospiraceae bacterium]|nr:hypothetical protein [Lachnospiraceae bacterium]
MKVFQSMKSVVIFVILVIAFAVCMIHSETAFAKKYYSLQEIGLSGCTNDNVDYGILSVKGKTVKYVKYRLSKQTNRWVKVGETKTAKITSKTKYYMGNASKVSSAVKSGNGSSKKQTAKKTMRRNHNINTEKWITRTNKSKIKKSLCSRNNEICISKGKITKILINIAY